MPPPPPDRSDQQVLLDFSTDMLALLDRELCFISVNAAYAHMFGQPASAFIGRSSRDLFAHEPVHYEQVIRPCMQQALDGQEAHFESWIDVPSFGAMYLDIRYLPVRAGDGSVRGCAVVGRDRTEAMRSIEALKRSETLLKRTQHIAHLGGWSIDPSTWESTWTDEMYEIHEVPRDYPLTESNIARFLPPAELARVQQALQAAIQGERTEIVAEIVTARGLKRVRSISFPVYEHGTLIRIEGILQDITELSTMQQQLAQSEDQYRRLVEETNALVWEGDIDPPRFTYISPQAEQLTGFPVSAWKEPGFLWERVPEEERAETFAMVDRRIAAHQDFTVEYRFIRADGSQIWLHDSVKIIYDDGGKPVKFRGVMIDITRMKSMQTGLNRALRSLEHHKHILDRHAIVARADRDGIIQEVNRKFTEASGYSRDELVGQRHTLLKSGLHDAGFYGKLWAVINAGRVWQGEICNRRKNGELYWVYTTIVPIRDDTGEPEEFMSVSTEITELKRTEETLRRAQKMEAIGQLTGGIAHDFNNLLGIIVGNIELVELGLVPSPQQQRQLENARNAALRGSVLTKRLLNFSHQAPVAGQATDLNRVMRGMEVLVSKSLTALVQVELDLCAEPWPVDVDPGDFEDAIVNLSINASDAMPHGGKLRFTTRNLDTAAVQAGYPYHLPAGQYVEIRVEDSGIGMPDTVMEKIFEPYFTTKPSDKGSGLGLPMVYGFVKRSKGHIFVESTPGMGSCFIILLPRSRQVVTQPPAVDSGTTHDRPAARAAETILLVDDEADILRITRTNLELLGYQVLTAGSGDEALETLRQHPEVDLLFTDIVMPGTCNGFELGAAALALRPQLKLLFTTGYARVEGGTPRAEWRDRIIHKPYRSGEVARRIRAMLDAP